MSLTLSPEDIDAIAERVAARIRFEPRVEAELLDVRECGVVLGVASRNAVLRHLSKLGVRPVIRGRYSRRDLGNAIGRIRHRNDMAARREKNPPPQSHA